MEFNSCWHFSKWLFKSLIYQNPRHMSIHPPNPPQNLQNPKRNSTHTNASDCGSLVPVSTESDNFSTNCIHPIQIPHSANNQKYEVSIRSGCCSSFIRGRDGSGRRETDAVVVAAAAVDFAVAVVVVGEGDAVVVAAAEIGVGVVGGKDGPDWMA